MQMHILGYGLYWRTFNRNFFISMIAAVLLTSTFIYGTLYLFSISQTNETTMMNWYFIVGYAYTSFVPVAFLIVYAYFLLVVRMRFRLLNVAVRNALGPSNVIARLHGSASDDVIHSLNILAQLHDTLTDGMGLINECYSMQVSCVFCLHLYVAYVKRLNIQNSVDFGEFGERCLHLPQLHIQIIWWTNRWTREFCTVSCQLCFMGNS